MDDSLKTNRSVLRSRIVWVLALLFLTAAGFLTRSLIVEGQIAAQARTMENLGLPLLTSGLPFTYESALQYRRDKILYDRGRMAGDDHGGIDTTIGYPDGVRTRSTYTVFVDGFQVALIRMLPESWSFAERARFAERLWFCMGIPLLAVFIARSTGSRLAGGLAGALYAFSIASVIRSTGQELFTENTALPFLLAHLLARSMSRGASGWRRFAWGLASGLALGAAVCAWDLIQFYIILWSARAAWAVMRSPAAWRRDSATTWYFELGALFLVALLSQYHRAHGLLWSPALMLSAGTLLVLLVGERRPALLRWAVLLAPVAMGVLIGRSGYYGDAYGHFATLIAAKLRFLNEKPADPALLNFDQRILWVPALHSANLRLTLQLLPAILPASLLAALAIGRKPSREKNPDIVPISVCLLASILAYVFFARFHVFVAVFAAAAIGLWVGQSRNRRGAVALMPVIVAGTALLIESVHTFNGPWEIDPQTEANLKQYGLSASMLWGDRRSEQPEATGRGGRYYAELRELTDWLEKNASPLRPDGGAVLADFGVSGDIAAYGKCEVVLHPKFETRAARETVRTYAEQLFKGTTETLREWADRREAKYLVFSRGAFSTNEMTLQLRYMVDALNAATNAPARLFEAGDADDLFRLAFHTSQSKYRVYRILSASEQGQAAAAYRRAEAAFARGDRMTARTEAQQAFDLNPRHRGAVDLLLRLQGVEPPPARGGR